jgi:hypothetical protein
MPELRPRQQRNLVLIALSLFVASLLFAPQPSTANGTGGTASCTRSSLALWNGSGTSTTGSVSPCVSGAMLDLSFPFTSTTQATINGVALIGCSQTVKDAAGDTISPAGGMCHVAFNSFLVTNENAAVLKTNGWTGAAPSPSYNLSINPSGNFTIGGNNVLTDLWVDGNSTLSINDGSLCALASYIELTSSSSAPCTTTISKYGQCYQGIKTLFVKVCAPGMLQFLGLNNFPIAGMDLKIYYLVTHNSSGGPPGGSSVQLPNTTITVS